MSTLSLKYGTTMARKALRRVLFSNQNKPQTSETLIVTDIQQIFGHLSNKGSDRIVQTWTNNRQTDGLM